MPDVSVLGAGAWGAALAMAEAAAGKSVTLWSRRPERASRLAETRSLAPYLPDDVALPRSIAVTDELSEAMAAPIVLAVMPAQALRGVLEAARPRGRLILCCKGVERETGALMTEVAAEAAPEAEAFILSGPNFAIEVANGLPAAATLAGEDIKSAALLASALSTPTLRLYPSDDPAGVALGGALKNVMAIAAGAVEGAGLGENARAAVATRGLAEMARIAAALGADRATLMGLAGVGDLMLTCSGRQSRNYSLGVALGEGRSLRDVLAERQSVSEGVATAGAARSLATKLNVDAPIVAAVDDFLAERASLSQIVSSLMSRPPVRDERA